MARLPLEGVRVLDVTGWWAGPYATERLADLGAEVIKVESIQRFDGARVLGQPPGPKPYERAALYVGNSRGKYGCTIDLTRPQGVELFKELLLLSDVVIENYRPRVMDGFGLGYDVLKQIKPDIIMLSMPSFGLTGPWKDFVGWQQPVEQMSGLPMITGYSDGLPTAAGVADPVGGMNAAIAIVMALLYRRRTGKGQYVDLSQIEGVMALLGELFLDYTMNGRVYERQGNDHPSYAPHQAYRCLDKDGEERWVAIVVTSDAEWAALCQAMGDPPWSKEPQFADALSRWKHRQELDALLGEWTGDKDAYQVMHLLQKAGVPAGAVMTSADLLSDPHLAAREYFEVLDRPYVGTFPYPGSPMKLDSAPLRSKWASPTLGQHNDYVFRTLLGKSQAEIAKLEQEQIIGTEGLVEIF